MLTEQIRLVIREIVEVADCLYQEKLNMGYEKLNITLNNIMKVADSLFALSKENKLSFEEKRLIENLTNAMKAMEEKDSVLLADILVYEIGGQLLEVIG